MHLEFPVAEHPFFDPDVAQRLAVTPLIARGSKLGTVSGRHQSPHRGSSVEFAQYRRYQPGDDLRRLDWRAYGRSERYYVKEFDADTNLRLVLVVDSSGSMGFSNRFKLTQQLASTLAFMAVAQGDAAGLLTTSQTSGQQGVSRSESDGSPGIDFLPPRRAADQVSVLFDRLAHLKPKGESNVPAALHHLAQTVRQRAMVVIISDLLFPPQAMRPALEHLGHSKHDVVLLQLADPEELQPSWNRPVRLLDMENEQTFSVDPDQVAHSYRQAYDHHLRQLRDIAADTGIDYHLMVQDQTLEALLSNFLAKRASAGGAGIGPILNPSDRRKES